MKNGMYCFQLNVNLIYTTFFYLSRGTLRRDIVPLIVEPGYKADGWLGPLVLNNLYFDLSEGGTTKTMQELIKELDTRGKSSSKSKCVSI